MSYYRALGTVLPTISVTYLSEEDRISLKRKDAIKLEKQNTFSRMLFNTLGNSQALSSEFKELDQVPRRRRRAFHDIEQNEQSPELLRKQPALAMIRPFAAL